MQMIDTLIDRVHQHGTCVADTFIEMQVFHKEDSRARVSRSGTLAPASPFCTHDRWSVRQSVVCGFHSTLILQTIRFAHRGCDTDRIRKQAHSHNAWANFSPKPDR
jgi:hypothetical protein